jgi:PAS domain S-box-containing protein
MNLPLENLPLSSRERDILQQAIRGHTDRQIAVTLGISESTIKTFWERIREKLNATNRSHAIANALLMLYQQTSDSMKLAYRIVEENLLGVLIADCDGQIYEANDAWLRMVGRSREDMGSLKWNEITPPEFLPCDERAVKQLDAIGFCKSYVKEYIRPDGSRVQVILGAAWADREERRCICYCLDISSIDFSQLKPGN